MHLTIGFSPCPNDTFIFDALVNGKIDTGDYTFEVVLEDVEQLNQWALKEKLDITKLSYHAFLYLTKVYNLLESGSALGRNCGPLLIAKKEKIIGDINACKIAIPGEYTTAHFLLKYAYPSANNKTNLLFSDIESAIANDEVDLGVIIHENRFTYKERGFKKVMDLGEHWESQTGVHIPLGGIVIKKSLGDKVKRDIDKLIYQSICFAYDFPQEINDFILSNAQEMEKEIVDQHINLYVNEFSKELGAEGHKAVKKLFEVAKLHNLIK